DAGILDLAGRYPSPLVGGDVAGVIARCLHGVDADFGEIGQRVRQFGELDPVELDVLPRGEVAVAAVVFARDMRQRPQLLRRQRAVGYGAPDRVGVQLQIDAVLQPQHLELVLGEFARETALHLVAEFGDALADQRQGQFVIRIPDGSALRRKRDGEAFRPDMFAEIAGPDRATILDLARRHIGADRARDIRAAVL